MVNNVLVIDEDRNSRGVHRRKLSSLQASLQITHSADEALDKIERKRYDIIIIQDRGRKDCNGPEFYDKIRNTGYSGPILVLTSNPSSKRERYNGILDLVHKSVSSKNLCSLIENYYDANRPHLVEQISRQGI